MTYEDLIKTVTAIVNDENVLKDGLVLSYYLDETNHRKMNEELFYRSNPPSEPFQASDEYEVEVGGIIVKFIKR
jgi:hypothetical protein